ncbi:MAG TPA: hypothetical protein EYQ27_02960, partial [Gemmatimonadetes bacterium]|nr:hypothetical protein [Gemmatimonadota bacterium]
MAIGSTHRDPRSIITPDAFDVSEDLLGTPLAPPIRRLLAWPIDFAVIGFVTLVTNSFSMILGLVVEVFFMRTGFKRTPVKGSVFGRAMRASVGCLGLFIGVITASSWALFGFGFGSSGDDEDDGRDELLCVYDSSPILDLTYIKDDDLNRWLAQVAAGTKVVLLDCCHAGTGTKALYRGDNIIKEAAIDWRGIERVSIDRRAR